jgi:pimeloyl-ACP methyl ester carboxylesterase
MTWKVEWRLEERKPRVGPLGLHLIDAQRADAQGDGRTLLMLHGLGSHGDSWLPVIPELEGVDRVICPDHRGHGHSDWSRDGYWLHDYANDVRGLLDQLGVEEVGVVGHSLGARVAMLLAPMLGERLTSLALLDAAPNAVPTMDDQAAVDVSAPHRILALDSEEQLMTFLRAKHPDFADEQLEIRARSLYRLNWAGMLIPRTDPEVYWLLGREGLREVEEAWEGLRTTKSRTLVLRAAGSAYLDEELGRRMVDALTDGTYQEVPLTHFMHYQDPALVAAVLNDFHAWSAKSGTSPGCSALD